MRIGIGIGKGIGFGGRLAVTPSQYLESLSPVYLRTTPLVCDGDDYVDFAPGALSEAANCTVIIAFAPAAQDAANSLVDADNTDFEVSTSTGGAGTWSFRTSGTAYAYVAQSDADPHILTCLFRGGEADNATRLRMWLDGAEKTGGDITYSGAVGTALAALAAGRVGARTGGANPTSGTISAVAVYASDQLANLAAIHAAFTGLTGIAT